MLKGLEGKFRIVEDEGIEIDGIRVRCSYLAYSGSKLVMCIEETVPNAESPALDFVRLYARVRGARYAAIVAEELKVFDVVARKRITIDEIDEGFDSIEATDTEKRLVAFLFKNIHCGVGRCEL